MSAPLVMLFQIITRKSFTKDDGVAQFIAGNEELWQALQAVSEAKEGYNDILNFGKWCFAFV